MGNDNLVITRENYQGYLELFELRVGKKLTEQYQECDASEMCAVGLDLLDEIVDFAINNYNIENIPDETKKEIKLLIQQYQLFQQKTMVLKDKYPYLECNFSTMDMEVALTRVKLLCAKHDDGQFSYKINYDMFNKFIEVKETLENALLYGEQKYKFFEPCTTIPHVKIKKK